MRILTWNCHRATAESPVWDYLTGFSADIMLLQEVSGIPDRVRREYDCAEEHPVRKDGRPQHFRTALLVRGRICGELALECHAP